MACKVHRVRFYHPRPLAVNSLAYNSSDNRLAISREDASIEIWDMNHYPFLLKTIPGFEKGSVEALCWVDRRLISTGLGGTLVEWDLESLTSKWSALLTGYAAWCLDVDSGNNLVAVGTEQGYLNLFRVEPDQFVHEKLFDKQEGRIICCKFNMTGHVLVTGSMNTIRIWDVSSGQALHRMSTRRRGIDNIVWRVAVLSDMTVVAGDSAGQLTFWDGNIAEQIESFAALKADALSLVVSKDERKLYVSGVDPTIVCFSKVEVQNKSDGTKKMQWVKDVQRHVHEHDVRALALNGDTLISLGADGYMALSRYPPKWLLRVPPLPPAPRVLAAVASTSDAAVKHKLLLLRYSNHLEVWKLGRYCTDNAGNIVMNQDRDKSHDTSLSRKAKLEEDSSNSGLILQSLQKNNSDNRLKVEEKPVKLVSIRAKGSRQMKSCTISPDGQYIVYSTDETIRVFNLEIGEEEDTAALVKVPFSVSELSTCSRTVFTEDSRELLLHTPGRITSLHVDGKAGVTLHQQIPTAPHLKEGCILHLETMTTDTQTMYVACADTGGCVAVWRRERAHGKLEHYATLPRYSCVPSALALDRRSEKMLLVYVDNSLVEYELAQRRCSAWTASGLPKAWSARKTAVTGASYHPADSDKLLLNDHTTLWILCKNKAEHQENGTDEPAVKKKAGDMEKATLKIFPFKYLAGWAWLGREEAVAVEVLPENIISQLPPVLATKRFPAL